MKFKLTIMVLLAGVVFTTARAQDNKQCETGIKTMESHVAEGNYTDAIAAYGNLKDKCPKVSERLYTVAEAALKYTIEASLSAEERQKHIDNLVALYKQYDKNFPQNNNASAIKEAVLLDQYQLIDKNELYKRLDGAFKKNPRAFTDYNALDVYFQLYIKNYEEGKGGITPEQFIEKYGEVSGQVTFALNNAVAKRDALQQKQQLESLTDDEKYALASYAPVIEGFEAVDDNVNILASKHFTCDKLQAYYDKNYDTRKEDAIWLHGLVEVMFKSHCYNAAIVQKSAEALHALRPTAQSAFYLGNLAQRKAKNAEAIKYYEEAAKMEKTAEAKAERYYTIATLLNGSDKKQAKEYLLKAVQMNPKSGKPYISLAEMYVSPGKDCKLNDFEKKALNWLAIETLKKAEQAEPKYKVTTDAMAKRYTKNAPNKDEVKAAGLKKGKKITFGCWINETITIPSL